MKAQSIKQYRNGTNCSFLLAFNGGIRTGSVIFVEILKSIFFPTTHRYIFKILLKLRTKIKQKLKYCRFLKFLK